MRSRAALASAFFVSIAGTAFAAEMPDAIVAAGTVVLQAHAVGAQIYECKADAGGRSVWQFREPIASLFVDGKTVGQHFAGPSWQVQGSMVVGKTSGKAPGATAKDIPWLKLDVVEHHGDGPLKNVSVVQRINTSGGNLDGACDKAGDLRAEPYAADYVFVKTQ
jgi:hypothetical protein